MTVVTGRLLAIDEHDRVWVFSVWAGKWLTESPTGDTEWDEYNPAKHGVLHQLVRGQVVS